MARQCGALYRTAFGVSVPNAGDKRGAFCSPFCLSSQLTVCFRCMAISRVCEVCDEPLRSGKRFCSLACSNERTSFGGHERQPSPKRLSEAERAWLAALIDSEGHVQRGTGRSLHLTITNTSRELIDRIAEVTGTGSIRQRNDSNAPVHWKPLWYWSCYSSNARSLLDQCQSWLIVKRGWDQLS